MRPLPLRSGVEKAAILVLGDVDLATEAIEKAAIKIEIIQSRFFDAIDFKIESHVKGKKFMGHIKINSSGFVVILTDFDTINVIFERFILREFP